MIRSGWPVGGIAMGMWGGNPLSSIDSSGLKMYPDDFMGPLPRDGYRKNQMTNTRCGLVPPSPAGVSLVSNLAKAKQMLNPFAFRNLAQNKGEWDFKQLDHLFQDFGNFHFGAVGASYGFYRQTLLREAGMAQQRDGTSRAAFGQSYKHVWDIYGGVAPYGDDPEDQSWINQGVDFCRCKGY